jgi:hypothetical protein
MRDLGAVLDHEEPLPHPACDQAQKRLCWAMSAFVLWVNRVVLSLRRLLPFFPDKQTSRTGIRRIIAPFPRLEQAAVQCVAEARF